MSQSELSHIKVKLVKSKLDPAKSKEFFEDCSIKREQFQLRKCKVAIFGAGITGLSCAKELVENGQDVTVFEAEDRIGGRAQSTTIGNKKTGKHIVEKGGELIDESYSTVRGLSRELGVEMRDNYLPGQTHCNFGFRVDGKHISRTELVAAIAPFVEMLSEHKKILDSGTKQSKVLREELNKLTCTEYFESVNPAMPEWAVKTLKSHIGGEWGPSDVQGALIFIEYMGYEEFTSENPNLGDEGFARYTFKNGTNEFTSKLADRVLNNIYEDQGSGRIFFNTEVVAVSEVKDGIEVTTKCGNEVKTEVFEYAVGTIPTHLYKKIDISGLNLPPSRLDAINSVEFGTDGKGVVLTRNSVGPDPSCSTIMRDDFMGSAGDNWRTNRNNIPGEEWVPREQYLGEADVNIEVAGGRRNLMKAIRSDMDEQFAGGDHSGPAALFTWHDKRPGGAYASWGAGELDRLAEGLMIHHPEDPKGFYMAGDTQSMSHNGYMEGAARGGQTAASHIIGDIVLKDARLK